MGLPAPRPPLILAPTARGTRDRKHSPRQTLPRACAPWLSGPPGDTPIYASASVPPLTPTLRGTYRLRTWSGSEPAGEASAGTRAGAVRAGILQVADYRTALNETPAFSRARKPIGRRRRKRKQHVPHRAREWGGRPCYAQRECACAKQASTPPGYSGLVRTATGATHLPLA